VSNQQTIVYGEEAIATLIAVVDVWPSGDFLLEIVSLHAPRHDLLLFRR
jgi:hypothetical protein